MDQVVHFEVPADDKERAKKFYSETFGWQIQNIPEMDYTVFRTVEVDEKQTPKVAGAINGGLFQRQENMSHPQFFMKVQNIDEKLEMIQANGGTVVREKTKVGEIGFVANFKDSEGNVLGLWQDA